MDWAEKVCVITGASSGLGRRIASDLAAEGASVCLAARRTERLEEIAAGLPPASQGRHSTFTVDVSDPAQVASLADHVREAHGRCDVLVNNAGMSRGRAFEGEASLEDLEAVFATNFFGAVRCTAALLPLLEESAPSHVVNVASIAGRIGFGNSSAYCSSKFALVGWSEAIQFDLKPRGVKVSLVEPGPIPTEGFPQTALIGHPLLRRGLGSAGDVSRAVRSVIEGRGNERVVPRAYYLAQFPKLMFPGLFRAVIRKFVVPNARGE